MLIIDYDKIFPPMKHAQDLAHRAAPYDYTTFMQGVLQEGLCTVFKCIKRGDIDPETATKMLFDAESDDPIGDILTLVADGQGTEKER